MIPFASLLLGAPRWLLPAAVLLAVGCYVLFQSYRHRHRHGSIRWGAPWLKGIGLAALAVCLVEPLWNGTRAKPRANLVLIVADNSRGMTIRDPGAQRSRGAELRAVLTDRNATWQVRLEQDFKVRRYTLDTRLHRSGDLSELTFQGPASAIGLALRTVRERFEGRPVAGVLLFTDGNATDLSVDKFQPAGLPPVYPVLCGSDRPPRDVGIVNTTVTQTAFDDAPVSIQADVRAAGFSGTDVVAWLVDESGQKLSELTHRVADEDQVLSFRFELRQHKPGVSFYRIRVGAKQEPDQPQPPSEVTLVNNSRLIAVNRGTGPYHVLYVAGRPNWEYKFLRRALEEEEQIRLLGMIRVARREPKFKFLGRAGDESNPLFRGFKDSPQEEEDTEQYDEPVLVRLGTLDDAELRDGFPKTREQLYAYHAVVLDDLEAAFFTQDQMTLLRRFVSERGGGFMMLGGQESFQRGKYDRTTIEELLPVYLAGAPREKGGAPVQLALTREGWLEPWVRLRRNETDEKARLASMPEFRSVNRVDRIKPGASVLASVADKRGKTYPALVAQRFGQGRSAALLVGDLWRWGLHQDSDEQDLQKAWRQTIRWLVADVPGRVQLHAQRHREGAADIVQLETRVRDRKFEAIDNSVVTLTVRAPDGQEIQLDGEPSLREPGLYEAAFVARDPGPYHAKVEVTEEVGEVIGRVETGWTTDPAADEFRQLRPNRQLLENIAGATGGEMVRLDELKSLVTSLPRRRAPITEQWAYPLWHRASVFLFAMACLIAEWGLRRWRGLV